MTKTDKMFRKFVKALLKYAENDKHFNPDFTVDQIPEIFTGWTELEFNIIHHGAGIGCCTCIGPGRYKVNVGHCNTLKSKFTDSDRTKWRLWVAIISVIIGIILWILNYAWNH